MIDKQQVELHFSKNAANYDQYAQVQKKMRSILMEFMLQNNKDNLEAKSILEIGCGTGALTHALTEFFPSAHITAVDIAPGMIATAKPKFKNSSVDFICSDIEQMNLKRTYDIIISNATFQWFNHMPITIKKLYAACKPNGILCFSTFGQYTFHELNKCFEKTWKSMSRKKTIYPGQSFYSLDALTTLCKNALTNDNCNNKILLQCKEIFEYEYFNNCKEFLYSIKKIGACNSNKGDRNTSPTFIKKVIELYDKDFMKNDRVKATYHCLFYKLTKN